MNLLLLGAALVAVTGAIVAVGSQRREVALLGLAVSLLVSPVVADPLPSTLAIGVRLVAVLLASYLLWIATRPADASEHPAIEPEGTAAPSRPARISTGLGWPAEALAAAAAFVAGLAPLGVLGPRPGPIEAQAAGFALIALSAAPLVVTRDPERVGYGLLLLLDGVVLVLGRLVGTPDAALQLAISLVILAIAVVTARAAMLLAPERRPQASHAGPASTALRRMAVRRPR